MVWAFLLHQLSEGNYMANTLPRKALISISSFNGAIYPNGHKTGLFFTEAVSRVGADYSSPMGPFDDYSITAGRVTTGTNPASARSAAERAVKVFESIEQA
jgi:putative intracellular protease/amidase